MKFKLILAMVANDRTDDMVHAAREHGATGCTVITNARGEGLKPAKTFLGLNLVGQRDVILVVTEEHLSRSIAEAMATAADCETSPGTGIVLQIDIEDAIGLGTQMATLSHEIEDRI